MLESSDTVECVDATTAKEDAGSDAASTRPGAEAEHARCIACLPLTEEGRAIMCLYPAELVRSTR